MIQLLDLPFASFKLTAISIVYTILCVLAPSHLRVCRLGRIEGGHFPLTVFHLERYKLSP